MLRFTTHVRWWPQKMLSPYLPEQIFSSGVFWAALSQSTQNFSRLPIIR